MWDDLSPEMSIHATAATVALAGIPASPDGCVGEVGVLLRRAAWKAVGIDREK